MRPSNPPGGVALCKNLDSVAMAPQLLEEIRKRRAGGKLAAPAVSRPYNLTRASRLH